MSGTTSGRFRRLFLACVASAAAVGAAAGAPTLALRPSVIEMGTFYDGATVRISGTVAEGSQVAVVIRGPEIEESFNKTAKAGPIWINEGKVHVSGVPSLFICFSSAPMERMLNRAELDGNQLDEAAIRGQMIIRPPSMDQPIIRANYLTLKRQQGTFGVVEGVVRMDKGEAGRVSFSLDLPWPKRAAPAAYQVSLYECRDGRVSAQVSAPLEVREVGFPLELARMAKEKAALYGALCVLIAMVAGFGIDFTVTKLGKSNLAGH